MNADESTVTIASISDITLSDLSYDISKNATVCGKDLYEVTVNANGTVSLTKVETEINNANVVTGNPVVTDGSDVITYIDNATKFLVQVNTAGVITYKAVTGYENIEKYTGDSVVVDYVKTDADIFADYVYITGPADSAAPVVASDFVFITNDYKVEAVLNPITGGVAYYVVNGVIRDDSTTEPVKIDGSVYADLTAATTAVEGMKGYLFKVTTTDGVVASASDIAKVTSAGANINTLNARFVGSVKSVGDGAVVTNGVSDTEYQYNINNSTVIINAEGNGEVSGVSALKVGQNIYAVYDTVNYIAQVIFVMG